MRIQREIFMYFLRKALNSFFALLVTILLITPEFVKMLCIYKFDTIDRLIRTNSDSELFFITLVPFPSTSISDNRDVNVSKYSFSDAVTLTMISSVLSVSVDDLSDMTVFLFIIII
jgi:hypothetical protein